MIENRLYIVRAEATKKNNEGNYTLLEFYAPQMSEKELKRHVLHKFKVTLKRYTVCQ